MPRSSSTALYTRVDNSFSNPVVGTTISPTHADSFFDDLESCVNAFHATSASSVAIGTGSKSFTVASDVANKAFLAGTFVHVYSRADTADYMFGTVTSYSTSTGVLVVDVVATGGSGTNADWNIYQAGARGATGATGATGSTGGIRQAYSTTTADADPGAGTFRLNNATPASATAAYLDNADSGGATVSTIFDLWDDSGSSVRGFIHFEKSSDATVWAQFQVTGSVVDGTGYRKLTLANGAGSGAFTNGDTFSIVFYRTGDPGTIGGSTGATDNAILRADGTGGATVQNSAVSIDDSGNITGAGTIDVGNADTTISRSSAGVIAVEGVTVALNSTSATHTAGTIELGAATDTTISRASAGVIAVEGVNLTPHVPISSKSAAYTTVLGDANTAIYHPSTDNNPRTFTIDSNANVAYTVGTCLTFVNEINTVTIAIASDTLTMQGTGSTGSRSLAANGIATALKVASTKWVISGTGLT